MPLAGNSARLAVIPDNCRMQDEADRLIVLGNAEENAGNLPQACAFCRKAVELAPRYARAHLNLGIGLEAGGDIEGAVAALETALAMDPQVPTQATTSAGSCIRAERCRVPQTSCARR